jgi:outer membrane lipoprotein-sorting protein
MGIATLSLFFTGAGRGEEKKKPAPALGVPEIVDNTNRTAYYQGKDGRAQVSMVIKDKQGRSRKREFIILRRDEVNPKTGKAEDGYMGGQKMYVYFKRPADVNKMVFMVWKHPGGDDDRWLYLPALDLVKRIAASDKRTSFVGSNFFYEDVSGRDINADKHELVKTTDKYYVLKNIPRDPDSVEFQYYTMWIHRGDFIPVKIEYVDRSGQKYREYDALEIKKIQGYPTVTRARMKDLKSGGETTIAYRDVKYDIGLPESIFTERYLRRPPRKYMR